MWIAAVSHDSPVLGEIALKEAVEMAAVGARVVWSEVALVVAADPTSNLQQHGGFNIQCCNVVDSEVANCRTQNSCPSLGVNNNNKLVRNRQHDHHHRHRDHQHHDQTTTAYS